MSRIEELKTRLNAKEKILLDSGMGTELQKMGAETKLPLWSAKSLIEVPALVQKIHEKNIIAGAQIITTNTFRTNRRTMKKANLEGLARELTVKACEIARKARENQYREHVLIAGSMTTVEDCYRPDLVPSNEELIEEHYEQARFLKEGNVDFILIETINTIREAKIAIEMAKKTGLDVAISFVCRSDGNLFSGDSLEQAYEMVSGLKPLFVSVNCGLPHEIDVAVERLIRISNLPIGVYANSLGTHRDGLSWQFGDLDGLEVFIEYARKWLSRGVNLIGGCCGTSDEYIDALHKIIRKR